MTTTANTSLRIYVACLGCYNAGRLHGTWIDVLDSDSGLALDADEIDEKVGAFFKRDEDTGYLGCSDINPHEELAIHDTDGFPGNVIGEYSSFEEVAQVASIFERFERLHGENAVRAAFVLHEDADEAERFLEEGYRGSWSSKKDFAEETASELWYEHKDSPLWRYVDWDAYARDLFIDSFDAVRLDGEPGVIHVFESNI